MAGKRTATSDLNHDNWDQDEDIEDAGSFQKASDDVLKRRIIKTARRQNPQVTTGNGEEEDGKKAAFRGFTGFSSFAPPNPNSAFSFLSNSNTVKSTTTESSNIVILNNTVVTNGVEGREKKATGSLDTKNKDSNKDNDEAEPEITEYYAKLKGLNESVLSWIEKHVKENPFINLKPIFSDYDRYLTDLEVKHITVSNETKKELTSFTFKSNPAPSSTVSAFAVTGKASVSKDSSIFGNTTLSSPFAPSSSPTNKFSFGMPANATKEVDKPSTTSFIFGSANASKSSGNDVNKSFAFGDGSNNTPTTGSLFGNTATPFSFGGGGGRMGTTSVSTALVAKETETNEDEDEPPKVEFTPVVEQDHIYTIRCKVFVKKDGNFGDRGVGNMFLKKISDSEKVQLIVRADTNLGNLLCNFILSEAIPMQRMGKKDVMLVCIPTPDAKPPPVPILLRVKSGEEADVLLKELEKYKK